MNFRTNYMGLELKTPIVVSACPLSGDVENIIRMERAGAGAVVLFSLFEEQIRREGILEDTVEESAKENFPDIVGYDVSAEQYLDLIREAKERTSIPIIASLNGVTDEGWMNYARMIEGAGADGLELNVFFIPSDLKTTGKQVEERYLDIVTRIKRTVSIPVAFKLNPYFSAMGNIADELDDAHADALVLFNRFYQPDFDIRALKVVSSLEYSSSDEIRLPLLWIASLYGRLDLSLAATSGVQSATEVIKYLLAGADVVMTASALYKHGIEYISTMLDDMESWMKDMGFDSVEAFKGVLSQEQVKDSSAYQRVNYIRILEKGK